MPDKVVKSEAQWREALTPQQYYVCREKGTEPPFSGEYCDTKTPGTYHCAGCGQPLFHSRSKFDSRTGWPSFYQPLDADYVAEERDASHGMVRVEALCGACGSHLGHVFDDGPQPTGLRYCMNSLSLRLETE